MSWADYQPPTAEVPLGNGATGTVRGLNVDDLSALITNHLEPISEAVALYAKSKKDVYTQANLHSFVVSTAKQFPGLVSEVISLAADEPSLKGKKIGLGVQMSAIDSILKLTLEEMGGLGNLSLVLASLAKGVLSGLPGREPAENETPSQTSIGDAAKTSP